MYKTYCQFITHLCAKFNMSKASVPVDRHNKSETTDVCAIHLAVHFNLYKKVTFIKSVCGNATTIRHSRTERECR